MLPIGTLEQLRSVALSAMPDQAEVLRPASASDGMGGWTETWAPAGSYPCRVSRLPAQPLEREVAERLQGRAPFFVFLPHDAVVAAADRISALGASYEVLGVHAPTSYQVHTRCTCALVG